MASKVHADASKSPALSYKRLLELDVILKRKVEELFRLAEVADRVGLPEGLRVADEIKFRQARLATARSALAARSAERYQLELAAYEEKLKERQRKAQESGRKARRRQPQPPEPGARDKDQYNFTDPESRIMKNSTDDGFDQHYNTQVGWIRRAY